MTIESIAPLVAEPGFESHLIPSDAQALVADRGANVLGFMLSFISLATGYTRSLFAANLGETDLIVNLLSGSLL